MSSFNLDSVRAALPALRECTYLNTGSYGLVAEPVADRVAAAVRYLDTRGVVAYDDALAWYEEARCRAARLLNGRPEEIALTANATDGINMVASGLDWRPGDEVLISNQEHPAMTVPWYTLARRLGVIVRHFPIPRDGDPQKALDQIALRITPRTRLIGASHVSHQTGVRLPVRELCALARDRGVLSLIDGAQAVGVLPTDVWELGCDFYTANAHKWLCAPKGIGFLYGRAELLDRLEPAYVGAGSTSYDPFHPDVVALVPGAKRFEYGSRAHALYVGLTAALDHFEDLGWAEIWAHQQDMASYLKARILTRGWPLHTPFAWDRAAGLNTFSVPGYPDVDALQQRLIAEHRMYVQRIVVYRALRVSTAYFTSEQDIDRLLAVLDDLTGRTGE